MCIKDKEEGRELKIDKREGREEEIKEEEEEKGFEEW